jgi:ribokinase
MAAPEVIVIGSSNVDLVVHVPHLPIPGETILGGEVARVAGGKGANQAVAAQRAGAEVAFIGCLGDDTFADLAITELVEARVQLTHVRRVPGAVTGLAFITVADDGENSIVVAQGANAMLHATDVTTAQTTISHARIIVAQLEIPIATAMHALAVAQQGGVMTLLNPAPAQPLSDEQLALVDVLVCNETEATTLAQTPVADVASALAAAHQLQRRGPRIVIVTLGAQGAVVVEGDAAQHQPAFAVKVVDTTAAGDAFIGALAAQLAQGTALHDAVRYAGAAGALTVTQAGAQHSLPTRAAIEAFLAG